MQVWFQHWTESPYATTGQQSDTCPPPPRMGHWERWLVDKSKVALWTRLPPLGIPQSSSLRRKTGISGLALNTDARIMLLLRMNTHYPSQWNSMTVCLFLGKTPAKNPKHVLDPKIHWEKQGHTLIVMLSRPIHPNNNVIRTHHSHGILPTMDRWCWHVDAMTSSQLFTAQICFIDNIQCLEW